MTKIVDIINEYLGPVMVIVMLGTGIFLTVRMKFMQVTRFPLAVRKTVFPPKEERRRAKKSGRGVSQFQAFSAAIAGTVGTGNIVGVSTAIVTGGAGAVFWMWISALFGMMTKFSENVLGIYYRKRDGNGFRGGPMYYIEKGLGKKRLAAAFSVFCLLAAAGYTMTQINSISTTLASFSVSGWVTGLVVVALAAAVVLGGIQRIAKVTSFVVPFMALLLVALAAAVIGINASAVPAAFAEIFSSAFSLRAAGGGILGYAIVRAMRLGLARGVFSNEAGLGSSVMAHSESDVREPVQQGFWGILEVFLDTIVICTLMALVVLTTGADKITGLEGASVAMYAFEKNLGPAGKIVFSVVLPLFAFTTILSWIFYGERAVTYLAGKKSVLPYKIVILAVTFAGAVAPVALVWSLSDTFNALMAIPNLIALIMLGGTTVKITANYFARRKGADVPPMLSAYPEIEAEEARALREEAEAPTQTQAGAPPQERESAEEGKTDPPDEKE